MLVGYLTLDESICLANLQCANLGNSFNRKKSIGADVRQPRAKTLMDGLTSKDMSYMNNGSANNIGTCCPSTGLSSHRRSKDHNAIFHTL
jgi:hypothetical protein